MFEKIRQEGFSHSLLIGISSFVLGLTSSFFITSEVKWLVFLISFIGWSYFCFGVFKQIIIENKLSNKVLSPIFPFLLVLLMSLSTTYATTNFPPIKEKLFPPLIAASISFFTFSASLIAALIKLNKNNVNSLLSSPLGNKQQNYFFTFIGIPAIIGLLLYSIFRKTDIGEIFYAILMFAGSLGMFMGYYRRIKEKDELKKQIASEIYSMTYSLILPLLMLIGFLILRLLGENDKATILTVIFVAIILIENSVRYFVHKKYDYADD